MLMLSGPLKRKLLAQQVEMIRVSQINPLFETSDFCADLSSSVASLIDDCLS